MSVERQEPPAFRRGEDVRHSRFHHRIGICSDCHSEATDRVREQFAARYNLPLEQGWDGHPNWTDEAEKEWRPAFDQAWDGQQRVPCIGFEADCGGDGFSLCYKHFEEQLAETKSKPPIKITTWQCVKCGQTKTSWYAETFDGRQCDYTPMGYNHSGGDLRKMPEESQ